MAGALKLHVPIRMGGGNPIVEFLSVPNFADKGAAAQAEQHSQKTCGLGGGTLIVKFLSVPNFADKGAPAQAEQQSQRTCGLGGATLTVDFLSGRN